jgi:hypothetical protein
MLAYLALILPTVRSTRNGVWPRQQLLSGFIPSSAASRLIVVVVRRTGVPVLQSRMARRPVRSTGPAHNMECTAKNVRSARKSKRVIAIFRQRASDLSPTGRHSMLSST